MLVSSMLCRRQGALVADHWAQRRLVVEVLVVLVVVLVEVVVVEVVVVVVTDPISE